MLLTKEILRKLPPLYSQDGKGKEATVHVKFFFPAGAATWYATEYDPEDKLFFGWADLTGQTGEFGYFSLTELESVKVRGLGIERDLHFKPKTLSECLATRA